MATSESRFGLSLGESVDVVQADHTRLSQLQTLDQLCFEETWPVHRWPDHKDRWVALLEDQPVGFIVLRDDYIRRMAVLEEVRRQGIGGRLILESGARKMNICELNLEGQLFLQACGFICTDVIKHGPTPGRNGYHMELL